jgi:hypothetical protein
MPAQGTRRGGSGQEGWQSGVEAAHRRASLASIVVMVNIAICAGIGLVVVTARRTPREEAQLPSAFYVAALFLALGSIALRRTQLRWIRLQTIAEVRGRVALIKHLVTVTIVSTAMAGVIGILGLVLSLTGGERREVLLFSAVALVVALSTYPRLQAWKSTIEYLTSDEPSPAAGTG